jgi:hypothetical protein
MTGSGDRETGVSRDWSVMMKPNAEIEALRRVVARAHVRAPEVSKWSVGMHIHHLCLAMDGVCDLLLASEPPPPRVGTSILTTAVLLIGRIPRGRAESPDQVIPTPGISTESLRSMLDDSTERLSAIAVADPGQWFRHFAFGVLNRDRTLKFLRIHNRHHLRIIADILEASDETEGSDGR